MFDMLKNTRDAMRNRIDFFQLEVRSGGLSDIEVCAIIDGYASKLGLHSFHFFDSVQLSHIKSHLETLRCPPRQVAKCLWLPIGQTES